jgi:hypothetical protein
MNKKFPILDPNRALYSYENGVNFGSDNLIMNSTTEEFTVLFCESYEDNPYGI